MTGEELDALRDSYDVVPLTRTVSADALTPVAAFAALDDGATEAFLLESVERGESVGRYSFVGVNPRKEQRFERGSAPSLDSLRRELRPLRVWNSAALPPFFGGAVGWFGYGVARWSEALPDTGTDDYGLPDAELLFFDHVVAFDHVRQELILIANIFTADEGPGHVLLQRAEERLSATLVALGRARIDLLSIPNETGDIAWGTNMDGPQFISAVERAKEEIVAGEIFQIVLSQRWDTPFDEREALTLYRVLRTTNPSPYMFMLRTRSCTLVGTSPEMLVRLSPDGCAETRPIAGTRPRSRDAAEDARLGRELSADPKEQAEHLMLVDLGRNDIGRVSREGSVRVTRYAEIERYSHVMHLVSDVRSEIREEIGAVDLFLSAFPAGTVSGAPKIRAMELIDGMEKTRRGPYAGAVAYFGFGGTLDSCIAIRTILLTRDRAWVQAGAGIVYDSIPERELEETINKSAAMRRAVGLARAATAHEVRS